MALVYFQQFNSLFVPYIHASYTRAYPRMHVGWNIGEMINLIRIYYIACSYSHASWLRLVVLHYVSEGSCDSYGYIRVRVRS